MFKPDYLVRLSAAELRELRLTSIRNASVFTILTIPSNMAEMTANLKAPLVINTQERIAKQVVLQENDQPIKFPMFNELRAHLVSLRAQVNRINTHQKGVIGISNLPLSLNVELI